MDKDFEDAVVMHPEMAGSLIRNLYQRFSINEMIDSMYTFLGNPVMVAFSHKKQSMYYSCGESIEYEFNIPDETVRRRENAMGEVQNREDIARKLRTLQPVIIGNGDYFPGKRRILVSITDGIGSGHTVGTLAVFEAESPFGDKDPAVVKLFAEAISEKCSSQTFRATLMHTPYEQKIQNLIQGRNTDKDKKWLREVFGSGPYMFSVGICDVRKKDRFQIETLQRELAWRAGMDITILRGSYLVLLANLSKKDYSKEAKKLEAFAGSENLAIGLSDVFGDINELNRFYSQAKLALKYAEDNSFDQGVYYFARLQAEIFIHKAASIMGMEEFGSKRVSDLIDYDARNGSNYYETFLSYMRNGMNNERTRDDLHIHRNTLIYRLSRIREITMMPDNDESAFFRLYLADLIRREIETSKTAG